MAIEAQEFRARLAHLQEKLIANELDAFLVSAKDSIFYLTGISYEPLERPFFIIVRPKESAVLLVPALEADHLKAAPNVETVHTYWDYPSPQGSGWPEMLQEALSGISLFRCGAQPAPGNSSLFVRFYLPSSALGRRIAGNQIAGGS